MRRVVLAGEGRGATAPMHWSTNVAPFSPARLALDFSKLLVLLQKCWSQSSGREEAPPRHTKPTGHPLQSSYSCARGHVGRFGAHVRSCGLNRQSRAWRRVFARHIGSRPHPCHDSSGRRQQRAKVAANRAAVGTEGRTGRWASTRDGPSATAVCEGRRSLGRSAAGTEAATFY